MALIEKCSLALGFSSKGRFTGFSVLLKEIFDLLLSGDDIACIEDLFLLRDKLKKGLNRNERRLVLLNLLDTLKKNNFINKI